MNHHIVDDYMLFNSFQNAIPMMAALEVSTDTPYIVSLIQPENQDFQNNAKNIYKKIISLKHPNLVPVKKIIFKDNIFYFINEFVKGETFTQRFFQNTHFLEECQTRKYFQQIISLINYLHSEDFIIERLSFNDIFIDENDNIKIINYAISTFCKKKSIKAFKKCNFPQLGTDDVSVSVVSVVFETLYNHTINPSIDFQNNVKEILDKLNNNDPIQELQNILPPINELQLVQKSINIFEVLSSSINIDLRTIIDKKDSYERQFSFSVNKKRNEIIRLIKIYIGEEKIVEQNQNDSFILKIEIYDEKEKKKELLSINLQVTEIFQMKCILHFICVQGQIKLFSNWIKEFKNKILV